MPLRLVVVDDHDMFRETLTAVLDAQAEFVVVGHARGAEQACAVVADQRPDVVLLDLAIPGNGLTVARELREHHPSVGILVVSASTGHDDVAQAVAAGAHGYAFKTQGIDDLCRAVLAVARRRHYLPPGVGGAHKGQGYPSEN